MKPSFASNRARAPVQHVVMSTAREHPVRIARIRTYARAHSCARAADTRPPWPSAERARREL